MPDIQPTDTLGCDPRAVGFVLAVIGEGICITALGKGQQGVLARLRTSCTGHGTLSALQYIPPFGSRIRSSAHMKVHADIPHQKQTPVVRGLSTPV